MKCPKCKRYDLERPGGGGSDVFPCACSKCGGMWVEESEAGKLPDICIVAGAADTPPSSQEDPDSRTGLCPRCQMIMLRAKIDIDNPFYQA